MRRYAKSLVIALLLVFAMSTVAYAQECPSKTYTPDGTKVLAIQVQAADAKIYKAIEKAQFQAGLPRADIDRIINNLVKFTDNVVEVLDRQAAIAGVELIHEYITVDIGGRSVVIDPCRVPGV